MQTDSYRQLCTSINEGVSSVTSANALCNSKSLSIVSLQVRVLSFLLMLQKMVTCNTWNKPVVKIHHSQKLLQAFSRCWLSVLSDILHLVKQWHDPTVGDGVA